jgi:hypothetical protein
MIEDMEAEHREFVARIKRVEEAVKADPDARIPKSAEKGIKKHSEDVARLAQVAQERRSS